MTSFIEISFFSSITGESNTDLELYLEEDDLDFEESHDKDEAHPIINQLKKNEKTNILEVKPDDSPKKQDSIGSIENNSCAEKKTCTDVSSGEVLVDVNKAHEQKYTSFAIKNKSTTAISPIIVIDALNKENLTTKSVSEKDSNANEAVNPVDEEIQNAVGFITESAQDEISLEISSYNTPIKKDFIKKDEEGFITMTKEINVEESQDSETATFTLDNAAKEAITVFNVNKKLVTESSPLQAIQQENKVLVNKKEMEEGNTINIGFKKSEMVKKVEVNDIDALESATVLCKMELESNNEVMKGNDDKAECSSSLSTEDVQENKINKLDGKITDLPEPKVLDICSQEDELQLHFDEDLIDFENSDNLKAQDICISKEVKLNTPKQSNLPVLPLIPSCDALSPKNMSKYKIPKTPIINTNDKTQRDEARKSGKKDEIRTGKNNERRRLKLEQDYKDDKYKKDEIVKDRKEENRGGRTRDRDEDRIKSRKRLRSISPLRRSRRGSERENKRSHRSRSKSPRVRSRSRSRNRRGRRSSRSRSRDRSRRSPRKISVSSDRKCSRISRRSQSLSPARLEKADKRSSKDKSSSSRDDKKVSDDESLDSLEEKRKLLLSQLISSSEQTVENIKKKAKEDLEEGEVTDSDDELASDVTIMHKTVALDKIMNKSKIESSKEILNAVEEVERNNLRYVKPLNVSRKKANNAFKENELDDCKVSKTYRNSTQEKDEFCLDNNDSVKAPGETNVESDSVTVIDNKTQQLKSSNDVIPKTSLQVKPLNATPINSFNGEISVDSINVLQDNKKTRRESGSDKENTKSSVSKVSEYRKGIASVSIDYQNNGDAEQSQGKKLKFGSDVLKV